MRGQQVGGAAAGIVSKLGAAARRETRQEGQLPVQIKVVDLRYERVAPV